MVALLKHTRPINLGIIAFTMAAVKYGFLIPFGIEGSLSPLLVLFLILSTVCISAGGYLINDIYDIDIDSINKPNKRTNSDSLSKFKKSYISLTIIGILAGSYVSFAIHKPVYSLIFIGVTLLLLGYAIQFKKWLVFNNVLIALLTAFTPVIVLLFDIYPKAIYISLSNKTIATTTLLYFGLFAFYVNLMREIVKDVEDINGDYIGNRNTFAIVLGRERTNTFILLLTAIAIVVSLLALLIIFEGLYYIQAAIFLGCTLPLGYLFKLGWDASKKEDYTRMSLVLKWIMIAGLGLLLLMPFYFNN